MLIGEYQNKIGEKNRIALPKKFREILGNKVIVTKGYEQCLIVVSLNQWEEIIKPITQKPFTLSPVRDTSRFIIGSAYEADLDNQGRFVISQVLKEYASLKEEVSFLGLLNWVEIWDKNNWDERKEYIAKNSSSIAEQLNIQKVNGVS